LALHRNYRISKGRSAGGEPEVSSTDRHQTTKAMTQVGNFSTRWVKVASVTFTEADPMDHTQGRPSKKRGNSLMLRSTTWAPAKKRGHSVIIEEHFWDPKKKKKKNPGRKDRNSPERGNHSNIT